MTPATAALIEEAKRATEGHSVGPWHFYHSPFVSVMATLVPRLVAALEAAEANAADREAAAVQFEREVLVLDAKLAAAEKVVEAAREYIATGSLSVVTAISAYDAARDGK